jgi:hypothetical protein
MPRPGVHRDDFICSRPDRLLSCGGGLKLKSDFVERRARAPLRHLQVSHAVGKPAAKSRRLGRGQAAPLE